LEKVFEDRGKKAGPGLRSCKETIKLLTTAREGNLGKNLDERAEDDK